MRQKSIVQLFLMFLVPLAFLFYLGLIAIIGWAHWRSLHGFYVAISAHKILYFFFCMGLFSNVFLLWRALDKGIGALIEGYRGHRLRQGIGKIGWYLLTQLFLYDLPLELSPMVVGL